MANYEGMMRTNYFRVNDLEAFTKALPAGMFAILPGTGDESGRIALIGTDGEGYNQLDGAIYDEVMDEDREFDLAEIISKHLVDGEVAVLQHVGHEKHRYLSGYSIAVDSSGKSVQLDLDDIYLWAAREFGVARESITVAAY